MGTDTAEAANRAATRGVLKLEREREIPLVDLTEETSEDSDIDLADQDTIIVSQVPEAEQSAETIRVSPHSDRMDCSPECRDYDVPRKEEYRESSECSYDPDSDSSSEASTVRHPPRYLLRLCPPTEQPGQKRLLLRQIFLRPPPKHTDTPRYLQGGLCRGSRGRLPRSDRAPSPTSPVPVGNKPRRENGLQELRIRQGSRSTKCTTLPHGREFTSPTTGAISPKIAVGTTPG